MKWQIGNRILQNVEAFEGLKISGGKMCHAVSQSLNYSKWEIYGCIQFRMNCKKGYIIAFGFTKGSHEEAARLKYTENLDIRLIEVEPSLYKKESIFGI